MKVRGYRNVVVSLFLLLTGFAMSVHTAASASGYHLLKKITLGGEGGWDYLTLDAQARRLYISRGSHVMIVDVDSGALVGDIPGTAGVHGIALAPEFGKGFTSNGRDASVTVFDLKTLKAVQQIKVGQNPDAIIYDATTRRVFTFNGASRDATAIDAATGAVAGTVALGGRPEFAVADGRGMIYVNIEDKSEVVAFDSRSLAVKSHWPIAPGEEASGMAMDKAHRRLFIGCSNQLMAVMNADTGRVVATVPIGKGVDANAFDPETALAFSSNGDGTLTIVHEDRPDKYSVVENAQTQAGARTMALDAQTHRVYLPTAQFGPPPAPTVERPRPRPSIVPGTFSLLVLGK